MQPRIIKKKKKKKSAYGIEIQKKNYKQAIHSISTSKGLNILGTCCNNYIGM